MSWWFVLMGGHNFINLETLQIQSAEGTKAPHELKSSPYYDIL